MKMDPDTMLFINANSIGPMLREREARDLLRSEIDPTLAQVNRMLSKGHRIARIESTVGVEGDGLTLMIFMEKG